MSSKTELEGKEPKRPVLTAVLGVVLAVMTWWLVPLEPTAARMAALAVLMAAWWVTEAVPIPVTSLLPLVCMPLLGIDDLASTASNYGKPTIFLFLGGFMLALGLQRSGLHRRIALVLVPAFGSRPHRLLLGLMLACALLSMWISNTASVLVALPIALSIIEQARERGALESAVSTFAPAVMLGIAYAADIGGMATPVGTPPNLVLAELQASLITDAPTFSFGQWMLMGLPLSAVFLSVGWWMLGYRLFALDRIELFAQPDELHAARRALGPMTRDEKAAGLVFLCAALMWITGGDLELGQRVIPGWRTLTGLTEFGDASVAVLFGIALFVVPSAEREDSLLDWQTARSKVPWGLLLLFGGGFALAAGFVNSGLSASIGRVLVRLAGLPDLGIIALVCLVLTFLTEVTSNTATTTLVLPILAEAAVELGMDARALMIPATLSASCAFMMPVASPTQAIVFGSGHVSIRQMVRAGIWFNLVGVGLVTLVFALLAKPIFGIDLF